MTNIKFFTLLWCSIIIMACITHAETLIVDHTSVEKCASLSTEDIYRVKKVWANILGASHSGGYRVGCELLEKIDERYAVKVSDTGTPDVYTTNSLRISRAIRDFTYNKWVFGGSDQNWYTSEFGKEQTKRHLAFCNTNALEISVFALGWSWQVSWQNMSTSEIDPVYQVRWSGSSVGGVDGNLAWGLDSDDYNLTSNHVCMDTYLQATEQYQRFCESNNFPTKVIYTTAPPDYTGGEVAYQAYLKNQHIRTYVSNAPNAILFDFADILCWDNAGRRNTNYWVDHQGNPKMYEWIAQDNYLNLNGENGSTNSYHFGERGALRIAKAFWYMLAEISKKTEVHPVLIISAQSTNKTYGHVSPPLAVTYSGFKDGEGPEALSSLPIISTSVTDLSPVGNYPIHISGATSTNYEIQYVHGTLTVLPARAAGLVTSFPNPAMPGEPVVFTYTISPIAPGAGIPAGKVQFRIDEERAGEAVSLNGVSANYTNASLIHGKYTILAEYVGDENFYGITNVMSQEQMINTPPVPGADTVKRDFTNTAYVTIAELLGNDLDPDGDPIIFLGTSTNSANGSTVTTNVNGILYTTALGATNADTFTYTISDGWGEPVIGIVSVIFRVDEGPSPKLVINRLGTGSYVIRGTGNPGRTYLIQFTDDPTSPNWSNLGTASADELGFFSFHDQSSSLQRFYRSVNQ